MIRYLIIFFAAGEFANSQWDSYSEDKEYCNMNCDNVIHIGCNPDNRIRPECKDYEVIEINDRSVQELITNGHNKIRNSVAGGLVKNLQKACRMLTVSWDPELAKLAALALKNCQRIYDGCHNTKKYPHSDQMLRMVSLSLENGTVADYSYGILQIIDTWKNISVQVDRYQIHRFEYKHWKSIHEFVRIVNDRNNAIGCAATILNKSYLYFLCNYGVETTINSRVYYSCQSSAERCKQKNPIYPHLCASDEEYQFENINYKVDDYGF